MTDWRRPACVTPNRIAPPAVAALVIVTLVTACTGKPAVAPTPPATYEQKIGWILQLEDQRILHEPAPAPSAPASATRRERQAPAASSQPTPDLVALLADPEARVRRRAALAIGRVGLSDGVAPLEGLLADQEPEVRQMAAFALGLIGDKSAVPSLINALKDPSLLVQGSAAQALGLIGDVRAADPIGALVAATVQSGAVARIPAGDMGEDRNSAAGVFRLGVSALARLHAWNALAAAVLDSSGQPRVRWWPVAYALQWINDQRAAPALLTLAGSGGEWAQAFSARGLGALKDRAAVDRLIAMVQRADKSPAPAIEAVRALGEIGDARAVPVLVPLLAPKADPGLRLEAVQALGALHTPSVVDRLLDLASDPAPAVRAAAIDAIARLDSPTFMLVLSGLDPDPQWNVRAAMAGTLTRLPPDQAVPRLRQMLDDGDNRVIPAVLAALTKLRTPDLEKLLMDRLRSADPFIRKAAAQDLETLKPADAAAALAQAYEQGLKDPTYVARAAALQALAAYGADAAMPTLKRALTDPDWAVRVKAADLLHGFDANADVAHAIRPAPTTHDAAYYQQPSLVAPKISPQLYIDTAKGTIVVDLAVLDAPITAETLMSLARRGFFNNVPIHRVVPDFVVQDGDPRGDGDGGPGFTIRDELNERMYAPGTVGMALDWRDTGGSQFFITSSPQPRLDAGYTVVGRVTSGFDVVSRIEAWDVITRVRVWDGERMSGN
jgi:HEAT repeat protein/cyclophilin family peptidyl-prolyl cis-trans isomerase